MENNTHFAKKHVKSPSAAFVESWTFRFHFLSVCFLPVSGLWPCLCGHHRCLFYFSLPSSASALLCDLHDILSSFHLCLSCPPYICRSPKVREGLSCLGWNVKSKEKAGASVSQTAKQCGALPSENWAPTVWLMTWFLGRWSHTFLYK